MSDLCLDQELPPREELASWDKRVYDRAWQVAYPVLWRRGLGAASIKMAGEPMRADREDVVATAIEQFQRRVVSGDPTPPA